MSDRQIYQTDKGIQHNASYSIGQLLNGRKNNFDIIRFFAASLVLYHHAYPLAGEGVDPLYAYNNLWSFGGIGVAIFFIISGFLVTQSYERTQNILIFGAARILRIFPGLFVALLLSAFILGPLVTTLSVSDYFINGQTYKYLQAIFLFPMQWQLPGVFEFNAYKHAVNGSLWTIPFEVLCYFGVAILGVLDLLKSKRIVLVLFLSTTSVYMFSAETLLNYMGHMFGLQIATLVSLFSYFSAGMVIYSYRDSIVIDKYFAMISLTILFISFFFGGLKENFVFFGSYLIFYLALNPAIKLNNFGKYGDFSYGMYIYAFPVQQTVTYYFGGSMSVLLNAVISFAITIIIAIVSWYLIEKPILRFKRVVEKINFQRIIYANLILKKYKEMLTYVGTLRLGWKLFFTLLLIVSFWLFEYNAKPSVISFPYKKNQNIFHGGWLPQSNDEMYRWICKSASVELLQSKNKNKISIAGYVPKEFKDVKKMVLFINNEKVSEVALIPGNEIKVVTAIPINSTTKNKKVNLEIRFDGVYKPEKGAADSRELSAFISAISIY